MVGSSCCCYLSVCPSVCMSVRLSVPLSTPGHHRGISQTVWIQLRFAFDVCCSVSCREAKTLSCTEGKMKRCSPTELNRTEHISVKKKLGDSVEGRLFLFSSARSLHFTGLKVLLDSWCQKQAERIKFKAAQGRTLYGQPAPRTPSLFYASRKQLWEAGKGQTRVSTM